MTIGWGSASELQDEMVDPWKTDCEASQRRAPLSQRRATATNNRLLFLLFFIAFFLFLQFQHILGGKTARTTMMMSRCTCCKMSSRFIFISFRKGWISQKEGNEWNSFCISLTFNSTLLLSIPSKEMHMVNNKQLLWAHNLWLKWIYTFLNFQDREGAHGKKNQRLWEMRAYLHFF